MRNLKNVLLLTGTSAMLALTALTGCEMTGHHSGDRSAGRALDDKVITSKVEGELKDEPVYKFADVDVKTFAGVVQLSGFVDTDEQKQRAGELAQNVEGVARVVNNITLKPTTTGGNNGLAPTGRTNDVHQPNQPIQSNP
ncbi:MAG TPA: BON domain-containing protein [Candidatus Paceibacterota bacterium]|nr:BON domain-containing protein [Candidatus Paceibacterota bacterium]